MPKIMLDAGHTGKRWNAGAVAGYYESAVMWLLQLELADALRDRGFTVGCTRADIDTKVEVTKRGRKAKGYDLFLSLHSNAADDETVRRASAIYQTADSSGRWDEESRTLAELLVKSVAATMGVSHKTYSRLAGGDRDGDGKKDDNYYGVLHGARMVGVPGIILEHSFHTNPESCRWLMEPDNLRTLARAEADVLANYYGLPPSFAAERKKNWQGRVTPKNGLNIRTGPGTGYKKIGAMKMGTVVTILQEKQGWGRIADPKVGWICLDYIKKTKSE